MILNNEINQKAWNGVHLDVKFEKKTKKTYLLVGVITSLLFLLLAVSVAGGRLVGPEKIIFLIENDIVKIPLMEYVFEHEKQ